MKKLLLFFLLFFSIASFAQGNFFQITNGNRNISLICTSDSGYAINGYIEYFNGNEFVITKTNKNGVVEWSYINNQFDGQDSSNDLSKIIQSFDNGFIGVGGIQANTGPSNYNFLIVKLNSSGNLLWRKQFDFGLLDGFETFVENTDSTFIASGITSVSGIGYNVLVKFNIDGDTLWTKKIPITANFGGITQIVIEGMNYFLLSVGDTVSSSLKRRIAKMNKNGNLLWIKDSPDSASVTYYNSDFRMTKDSFLLALNIMSTPLNGNFPQVSKYDLQGNLIANFHTQFDVTSFGSDSTTIGDIGFIGNDTTYFGSENFYTHITKSYLAHSFNNIDYYNFISDKDKNIVACGRVNDPFNGYLAFVSKGEGSNSVGLSRISNNFIRPYFYPNPTSDFLNISLNPQSIKKLKQYSIAIYNSLGILLFSEENIVTPLHQINVSQFAKGFYYSELKNNGQQIATIKFIIN